jgi:pyruvate/2-oxoglutarate dehydrogenase complex dihydrolipoamide acyltransferase (E2) component
MVRAFAGDLDHSVRLGIEYSKGALVTLELAAGGGLGALAGSIARAEPGAAANTGDVVLLVAADGIDVFSPALVTTWPMVLGVATRGNRGRAEVTLSLTYDQDRVGHREAQRFLSAVGEFLEDPLVLLAG